MSNSDSFIDEVTEEVRRDRLFAIFRRYGWIGALIIVAIVGFSAWTEWTGAREAARAQAFGDAVTAALALDGPAQAGALDEIETQSEGQKALVAMLKAGGMGGAAELDAIAGDAALPQVWRDTAEFKRLTASTEIPATEKRARFEALTTPGAPLRMLAEEQIALLEVAGGETQAAIDRLNRIVADTETTAGLRQRAQQLIVALGGTPAT